MVCGSRYFTTTWLDTCCVVRCPRKKSENDPGPCRTSTCLVHTPYVLQEVRSAIASWHISHTVCPAPQAHADLPRAVRVPGAATRDVYLGPVLAYNIFCVPHSHMLMGSKWLICTRARMCTCREPVCACKNLKERHRGACHANIAHTDVYDRSSGPVVLCTHMPISESIVPKVCRRRRGTPPQRPPRQSCTLEKIGTYSG